MASRTDLGRRFVLAATSRREFLKRTAGIGALAAFGGAVLEACVTATSPSPSAAGSAATATPTAVKGGHITEAGTTEPRGLNPVLGFDLQTEDSPVSAMYEALLTFMPDGSLTPQLALSLPTVSADGLTYTFPLRKDVKWTDGTPLNADDIVFTYKLMYHVDYKAVPSPYRADLEAIIADVQAPDPYTVTITTKTLSAAFLALHSRYFVVPKHVLGSVPAAAMKANDFTRAPTVTSGPFKFLEWKSGDHISLVRNDAYHGGPPNIDTYVMKLVASANDALTQLQTGEVDLFKATTFARFDELAATPNLNVDFIVTNLAPRVWYNLDPSAPASQIFSSKAVRQALLYAADRQGVASAALFSHGAIQTSAGVFPPQSWADNPNPKTTYTYDKAKAQQMLDADGWKPGASGVREKNGIQLKFTVITTSDNAAWAKIATIFQQNWKDVGADVTIQTPRFAQLTQAALDRNFDMILQSAPYGDSPDPDPSSGFHSRGAVKGSGRNYSNYKNPQLDQLLEAAVATLDQAKRKALYFQVQDVVNDDVPSWSTPYWQVAWCHNKRVVNFGSQQVGPFTIELRRLLAGASVADGK